MNVAILGCGSLGGVLAARLGRNPEIRLTVLNRNPQIAEAIARGGLILLEGRRRTVYHPKLEEELPDGAPELEAVILCTKSNGLREACTRLLPRLAPRGFFIALQNGLVALDLAEAFGSDRVVIGSVLWGASMDAPGLYRITAAGPFLLGEAEARREPAHLLAAARLLSGAFPVRITADIRGALWSKLAITASFTSLGALTGLRFGELARRRVVRRVILAVGREVLLVARSQAIRPTPLAGGLDVPRLLEGCYPEAFRHLLIRLVACKHRRTESAMLDSLRRGRATEIDFINGRVVEAAERAGVPVPWNRAILTLMREMEAGGLWPDVRNLEELSKRAARERGKL